MDGDGRGELSMRPLQKYEKEAEGYWRDIPGCEGYQASVDGDIRRCYKSGYRVLSLFFRHKEGNCKQVKIHRKECNASRLIYRTFYGDIPDGYVVMHKDGIPSNTNPNNLVAVPRSVCSKKTGGSSRSQSVLKYGPVTMECVGAYRSARECARKNFFCAQSIMDRCNGAVKKAPALDGFEYCWEDDGYNTSYNRMVKRIEEARERGVI